MSLSLLVSWHLAYLSIIWIEQNNVLEAFPLNQICIDHYMHHSPFTIYHSVHPTSIQVASTTVHAIPIYRESQYITAHTSLWFQYSQCLYSSPFVKYNLRQSREATLHSHSSPTLYPLLFNMKFTFTSLSLSLSWPTVFDFPRFRLSRQLNASILISSKVGQINQIELLQPASKSC